MNLEQSVVQCLDCRAVVYCSSLCSNGGIDTCCPVCGEDVYWFARSDICGVPGLPVRNLVDEV